jgi:predicted NBD/HSP70 family sugar kinase
VVLIKTKPADINTIREINLSLVLNTIRQAGSISRADLVRQTWLSATTVSALADVLLDSGFIFKSGMGESSGGRPPMLLEFNYGYRHVLGVDLGATHITALAMDLGGRVVARRHRVFDVMQDPSGATAAILELVDQVLAEGRLEPCAILGMGVACPTPLEGEELDQISTVIFPRWAGYDLMAEIRRRLPFPAYLDNDANAGVVAERWWGSGRDYASLAYIKLATGVGSGLMINDEIYRGHGGTAGEIGHTTIDPNGPVCRCGNHGCMESFVGVPAILAEAHRRLGQDRPTWWSGNALTIEQIIAAALEGDPTTRSIVQTAGNYLGIAIANLVNLFNPGLIALGGDLVAAGDLLLDAVRAAVALRCIPKAASEVTILVSSLGDGAVAIGAGTLAMQKAFQPSRLLKTLEG